jgi:UDP-GlcNAc:undecaprenyl-phosphate GlcNAc-1-phosphate transferase
MSKQNTKILLMCAIAMLAFGLYGLVAMTFMVLLSRQIVGKDSQDKHGINHSESSRLGGFAITLLVSTYMVGLTTLTPFIPTMVHSEIDLSLWLVVLVCTTLGLTEDVSADFLTPLLRLIVIFIVFGFFFWQWPEAIPESIGVPLLDYAFGVPVLAWCVAVLFCVGFINAFNMSDGANGLIPGIAVIWAVIFYLENSRPIEAVLLFSVATFLIFNVISGWFFLGDAGSYGLGAIIALTGLRGVADGDFSAWFMASLLVYPCIDFIVSIFRRLREGRSPFMPDNDHLHNWLHRYFSSRIRSRVVANSLTGLSISIGTSGLVFLLYNHGWWAITSHQWAYLFGAQCLAYAVLRQALKQFGYSR